MQLSRPSAERDSYEIVSFDCASTDTSINTNDMPIADFLSSAIAAASAAITAYSVWRMFRTPKTITVTRKDNGKSVVINMRLGSKEGEKLTALLAGQD